MLLGSQRQDFNPPSPWGEGRGPNVIIGRTLRFQSTLPVGGGTIQVHIVHNRSKFQSTLPVGGGTKAIGINKIINNNFNPPSPWGEGRNFAHD